MFTEITPTFYSHISHKHESCMSVQTDIHSLMHWQLYETLPLLSILPGQKTLQHTRHSTDVNTKNGNFWFQTGNSWDLFRSHTGVVD